MNNKHLSIINMPEFDVNLSRKRIKNINLRIDREGNVNVSAPMKCSLEYIHQFLQKKQHWITTHLALIRNRALQSCSSLQAGDRHVFLGQSYTLRIHEYAKFDKVLLEGNHLSCHTKSAATLSIKQRLITNWQRQQMQTLLPALIQKWEAIIGVQVIEWRIKIMKSRWGTCNPLKKHICLNLDLIKQPLVCLEYVVVHELVHLLEASHNQRFYALMSQFMPEWKKYRSLLRQ